MECDKNVLYINLLFNLFKAVALLSIQHVNVADFMTTKEQAVISALYNIVQCMRCHAHTATLYGLSRMERLLGFFAPGLTCQATYSTVLP